MASGNDYMAWQPGEQAQLLKTNQWTTILTGCDTASGNDYYTHGRLCASGINHYDVNHRI